MSEMAAHGMISGEQHNQQTEIREDTEKMKEY
jgi:hypothetical protein